MSSISSFSSSGRRVALAIAAAACVCAFAPSFASAADFCVHDDACAQGGANGSYLTLQDALKAAGATPTADRIFVGPGTYTAPDTTGFRAPGYQVEIIGAGRDKTTLTGPTNTTTVLTTGDAASAVSNLRIVVPDANDGLQKFGLEMTGGTADGLAITAAAGSPHVTGAYLHGTLVENSTVTLPQSVAMIGIYADTDSTLRGDDVAAGNGIQMFGYDVHVDRARVTSNGIGIWAGHIGGQITNTLVRVSGDGYGILANTGHLSADAGLTVRNATVAGDGGASSVGIYVNSFTPQTATVAVDSTIVRGVQYPFKRVSAAPGTALLGIMYSSYDPFSVIDSGPGGMGFGQGNMASDPLFTGADDFHLSTGSPAVDAGDPNTSGDTVDLDGNARVVGGRRDIGAYETQPAAAPAPSHVADPAPVTSDVAPSSAPAKDVLAPAITGLKMTRARFTAKRGAAIRFTLSEAASVRVTIKRRSAHGARYVKFATLSRAERAGANRIAIKGRVALRPGRYRVTVSATDAAGNRSRAYTLKFRVLAPDA